MMLFQLDSIALRRWRILTLQTREIIADSIETVTCAQRHDANISIPGCDKNMPGVVMVSTEVFELRVSAHCSTRPLLGIIVHSS